jgi:hypothetical protein
MGYANKREVLAVSRAKRDHGEDSPQFEAARQEVLKTQSLCAHPKKDHLVVPIMKESPGFEVGKYLRYCVRCGLVLEKNISRES